MTTILNAGYRAIRSSDRDLKKLPLPNHGHHPDEPRAGTSGSTNSCERAKEIALAEVPGGTTVVKCQLDWDDGRQVYELELRNGRTEYDFEIDAQTGDIVSRDVDYDD